MSGWDSPDAALRNKSINEKLAKDKQALRSEIKMLILGTGESGKSTICKQMKILHSGGFTQQDRLAYREIVFANTLQSMQAIIDALPLFDLALSSENEAAAAKIVCLDSSESESWDGDTKDSFTNLWDDQAVKNALAFKNKYQLNDSAEYFFESINRIFAPGYVATDDDIIRARVRTTGILETRFKIGSLIYRVFDVGGQRSERRKWVNCFEAVNVLLFVVAVSEYDQTLYEDEVQNRISEAIAVFDSITNSRWFAKSTLVLFLNKIDLLKAKLPHSSLSVAFPTYPGDNLDYEQALQWLFLQFRNAHRQPSPLYHHCTCATSTSSVEIVISALSDNIRRGLLEETGLV